MLLWRVRVGLERSIGLRDRDRECLDFRSLQSPIQRKGYGYGSFERMVAQRYSREDRYINVAKDLDFG